MKDPGRQVCDLNPGFLKPEPRRWASRQTQGVQKSACAGRMKPGGHPAQRGSPILSLWQECSLLANSPPSHPLEWEPCSVERTYRMVW